MSIAVFFVYTGIEAAAGTWAYSLLTEVRAVPMKTAGVWVSLYWGALTVGRLLSGLVVGFVSSHTLLRMCVFSMVVGAAMFWLGGASSVCFAGLGLMGLASAPVFPSMIAATPMRLGPAHTANGVGFQIAAAVLGQSLLPGLFGLLAARNGLEVVGPSLTAASLVLLASYLALSTTFPNRVEEAPIAG